MTKKERTIESQMRLKGFLTALMYVLSQTIFLLIVVFIIVQVTPISNNETLEEMLTNKAGIISVVPGLIALLIIIKINFKELKVRVAANLKDFKTYLIPIGVFISYFLAVIVLDKISTLYFNSVGGGEVVTVNEEVLQESLAADGRILMLFYIILLAPILEELVFRYGIIEFFESFKIPKALKFLPYLIAAFLFTIIHETAVLTSFTIPNLLSFVTYFIPALILSYTYMFSNKNITALILAHILLNSASTLFS